MNSPRLLALAMLLLLAGLVRAQPLSYQIEELYSNADGSVQFVVLRESAGLVGQQVLTGRQLTVTGRHASKTFTFPSDLPSSATANARVLVGSVGFQALGLIAPGYVFPDRFLPVDGGTLALVGIDSITYSFLATDGSNAWYRGGIYQSNLATNFAGRSTAVPARTVTVVDFYNAGLDHNFISPLAPDIEALDSGRLAGREPAAHSPRGRVRPLRRRRRARCVASTSRRRRAIRISSPRRRWSARTWPSGS
jgi:hypothetical protein